MSMRTVDEIKADIKICSRNEFPKLLAELWLSLTWDIDIVRLVEICEAERDGRLLVLPCKVEGLVDKYEELTKPIGDEAETYTTGYRNGHKNGQAELIAYLLQLDIGTRAEAEAALDKQKGE
jgi:hypothetical protein